MFFKFLLLRFNHNYWIKTRRGERAASYTCTLYSKYFPPGSSLPQLLLRGLEVQSSSLPQEIKLVPLEIIGLPSWFVWQMEFLRT